MRSALMLLLLAPMASAQPIPLPKEKDKATSKVAYNAGDIMKFTADTKGDIVFVWPKSMFPGKRAEMDSKVLRLTTPYNSVFTITMVLLDEKVQKEIEVSVTNGIEPPPGPIEPPPDNDVAASLKGLAAKVDKLQQSVTALGVRVAALEQRPPPTPGPVALAAHVTFVGAETKPASLTIANNTAFRDALHGAGIKVHVLLKNDPKIAAFNLTKAVEAAGVMPCLIIQDSSGNVIGSGPMESQSAVEALIAKYTRR